MKIISRVVVCALISSVLFGKTLAKDEAMNICYASDEGYAIPTCVSIASILANCPPEDKLNILVVDTGLSEKSKKAIENLKKIRDFKLEFRKFDMERLKIFDVGEWSPSIRIKLYMNELFPNAEKAMWVNGNIIFRKNIKQLYDVDLTGKYFATYFGNVTHVWDGMVLYNLHEMNKYDISNKIITDILARQRTKHAFTGELALGTFEINKRYVYTPESCKCVDLVDYFDYDLSEYFAIKFVTRDGFNPWQNPRFLYPEIAIETYDEWHKYCDMTDYRGLKTRLENNYKLIDVWDYFYSRLTRKLAIMLMKLKGFDFEKVYNQ